MDYWKSPDWSDFFTTILISGVWWFKEENPTELILSVLKTMTWVWAEPTCSEASLWWESQRKQTRRRFRTFTHVSAISGRGLGLREGYCSAWLNKRRDEVGRLTDEVGTSLVSMHWSTHEPDPMRHTAPRSFPSPTCQQSITRRRRRYCKCRHYSHRTTLWFMRQWELKEHPARLSWTLYCFGCGAHHAKAGIIKCQFLKLWSRWGQGWPEPSWRDIKLNPFPQTASIGRPHRLGDSKKFISRQRKSIWHF